MTQYLPASLYKLEAMLADETDPIKRRAIKVRMGNLKRKRALKRGEDYPNNRQRHNARRWAAYKAKLAARSPEELARAQAEAFPDGTQTCRSCDQRLPLSSFDPAPTFRAAIWHYCRPCRQAHAEEAA